MTLNNWMHLVMNLSNRICLRTGLPIIYIIFHVFCFFSFAFTTMGTHCLELHPQELKSKFSTPEVSSLRTPLPQGLQTLLHVIPLNPHFSIHCFTDLLFCLFLLISPVTGEIHEDRKEYNWEKKSFRTKPSLATWLVCPNSSLMHVNSWIWINWCCPKGDGDAQHSVSKEYIVPT